MLWLPLSAWMMSTIITAMLTIYEESVLGTWGPMMLPHMPKEVKNKMAKTVNQSIDKFPSKVNYDYFGIAAESYSITCPWTWINWILLVFNDSCKRQTTRQSERSFGSLKHRYVLKWSLEEHIKSSAPLQKKSITTSVWTKSKIQVWKGDAASQESAENCIYSQKCLMDYVGTLLVART